MSKIKKECVYCGKVVERYPSQVLATVYCSRKCRSEYMKENHTKVFNCHYCGKEKRVKKTSFNYNGKNFCSRSCKDEWQKTGLIGANNPFFQKSHSKETKNAISVSRIGKTAGENHPQYNRQEVKCSYCGGKAVKTQYLIGRSERLFCSVKCHGKWKAENLRGDRSPTWNHDLSEEERQIRRKYPEYYEFITEVMKRDNYTCDICGKYSKWGDGLNAHHLNSYDWDKENRTNIDNGITLCRECHTSFHKKYGYGNNTKEQYVEFKEENV